MSNEETILIADDSEINRAILRGLFEKNYNLLEAVNGEQALMLLRQYSDSVTAVLLDLIMPEKDGYEVLEQMRLDGLMYHVPVIVITADDSSDSKVRVFSLGASDIITKPFEVNVVESRVNNIIELGRYRHRLETLVEEQSARARESNAAVIDMLSSVIDHRNMESGQHIRRIRMFTKILLEDVAKNYQEYGLDERKIQLIADASSIHDIGKIAIPDSILNKPGKLTPEEYEIMKSHTSKGCEILSSLDRQQDPEYLQYAYHICRYHHERWDGNGYPKGLKGDSTPICAQVVAIADCYDALTAERVYKRTLPQSQVFSMILNGECGVFSPRLLECLKNVRELFERLSREYADGISENLIKDEHIEVATPIWDMADNTLEQSQLKYFALLRYMDCTVMEVDLNTGIYHLVYLSDRGFSVTRNGGSFDEIILSFANSSVHPDDRVQMLKLLDGYAQELFEEGLTRRERRYRVLDRSTDSYIWCRATVLRINLDNPRDHKILILWQKEQDGAIKAETSGGRNPSPNTKAMEQLLGGVHKFRCDQYFTILQVSQSLVELLGYSEIEIREKFQNRYIEMIYPGDRVKMLRQFNVQCNAGKVLELEYRLVTKEGKAIWVSQRCTLVEEDGEEVLYGILLDITRSKQAQEELRLSLERYSIISDQTNDIIFEWDIVKDELFFSTNWERQYGYAPITKQIRKALNKASHIYPEDVPRLISLMDKMASGVPYEEAEFRIVDAKGKYRWRRVRATAQNDMDGNPFKAVGVMVDIDFQKRASVKLEEKAARDVLTGLYNKAAAKERVKAHLESSTEGEVSTLMLLDVDDFKQINDRYGHLFGDEVLVEVSAKLVGLFRGNDTIARIGGDEFMVFMPNVQREEIAEHRAEEIILNLQKMLEEDLGDVNFSCSIGLAFSNGRNIDYQKLFNQADRALYRAKAGGKNRFMCYHEEMEDGPIGTLAEVVQRKHTEIDSIKPEHLSLSFLAKRIFDILYDTAEFTSAVESIMALIGKMFGVSRVYIFEETENGGTYDNTFEWCGRGITPQKDFLKNIPYVQGGHDYRENFGSDGLFYCSDVGTLPKWQSVLLDGQSVLSVLQYAIMDDNKMHGFVGFDDYKMHRLWTGEQIDALTFIGKLLAVFLLKNRAQLALMNSLSNLSSVLDHQEVWIYVLDPDTYKLRYVNGKTKELIPEAQLGLPCYEVFYHREKPCENCILKKAIKTGQKSMELYNPYLKLWVLADASMVKWNQHNACLIACRDISAYKLQADNLPPDDTVE